MVEPYSHRVANHRGNKKSWNGKIYGGREAETITYDGASVCGIEKIGTLTSRGVLLDIASLYDVDELPGGHAISYQDCENAEKTVNFLKTDASWAK